VSERGMGQFHISQKLTFGIYLRPVNFHDMIPHPVKLLAQIPRQKSPFAGAFEKGKMGTLGMSVRVK